MLTLKPHSGAYKVDLNINTDDGVKVIDVVKDYLDQMPALRPLVMVLKGFLIQRGLNSPATSGLGSYSLICMVISFLKVNSCRSSLGELAY
jgi:non-canonical poly(A) RNA polymerase PAPD5/7